MLLVSGRSGRMKPLHGGAPTTKDCCATIFVCHDVADEKKVSGEPMIFFAAIVATSPIVVAWLFCLLEGLSQQKSLCEAASSAWRDVFSGMGPFSYTALVLITCFCQWGTSDRLSKLVSGACLIFTFVGTCLYAWCVVQDRRAKTLQAIPSAPQLLAFLASLGAALILLSLSIAYLTDAQCPRLAIASGNTQPAASVTNTSGMNPSGAGAQGIPIGNSSTPNTGPQGASAVLTNTAATPSPATSSTSPHAQPQIP